MGVFSLHSRCVTGASVLAFIVLLPYNSSDISESSTGTRHGHCMCMAGHSLHDDGT